MYEEPYTARRARRAQMQDPREQVLDAVDEAFNDFVFLNRKLDRDLPWDRLRQLVRDGVVTKQEITEKFAQSIERWDVSESKTSP